MFSLFKNLFNKPAEEKPVSPPSPQSAPPRPATPAPVAEKKIASTTPVAATTPAAAPAPPSSANETVTVSLKGIVATLPDTLKSRTLKQASPDVRVSVPLADAVAQLAKGSVKISFGQLRQQAPDFFTTDASQDTTPVSLPLGEILPQIRPQQLSRRTDQKRVEVPDEVTSAFGGRGSESARVVSTPRAPAAPATPVEPPKAVTPPAAPLPTVQVAPIAPTPVAPPAPIQATPISPALVATPPAPEPAEAFVVPEPKPIDNTPIKPSFSLPDPAALRPATPPAPAAHPPAPPVAAQPIKPAVALPTPTETKPAIQVAPPTTSVAPAATTLTVPLTAIIAKWPEGVRSAIATVDANQTSLVLPMAETEAALRKGKVQFTWKQIRSFLTPAVNPALLAEADEVMLDLPLAVLAPMFMAAKKPASAQKKVAVGENIPDLFKPKPPEPIPTPEPVPAPVEATPAPVEPVAVLTKKPLTPAEVIQQAVAMADVAGALITTTDGLLVDAQLPTGMEAAKIAAFVPQAYLRLAEFAKAMSGTENHVVTLQLDHAPIALFKHANIYCAVVGKRGFSLPLIHLAALLNELAAQPK